MATIEEYQNFVLYLKSYCERGIRLSEQDEFLLSDYDLGYCNGKISAFEDILFSIRKLDKGVFSDCG